MLADIVLDIPSKSLEGAYTYIVPDDLPAEGIGIGCAVKVPFGRRTAVGFVVGLHEGDPFEGAKPVEAVLSSSFFDEAGVACAKFLAKRYVAPLSVCVRLFTPPGGVPKMVREPDGTWRLADAKTSAVDDRWVVAGPEIDGFEPRKNAIKQLSVLEAVRLGDIRVSELTAMFGSVSAAIKALEAKGAVKVETRRRVRGGVPSSKGPSSSEPADAGTGESTTYRVTRLPYELTEGQARAIEAIGEAYDAHDGRVVLIDGVTGSGKTEVYLQAITRTLEDGKSAIMLVPEISLTPQTVARFHARFGDTVAVLHSRMSDGERFDQWEMIRQGQARVVVGARSALFAPLKDLGLVVIDEEHETTYKQESAPRYVTRDVAAWMMGQWGGTLVLGSATPSIESLYRANKLENWSMVEMPERANGRPMPPIEIVDMTQDAALSKKRRRGAAAKVSGEVFSSRLANEVTKELSEGHKVVLLLNQRGFAQYMLCDECGFVARCTSCSTTLTYHAGTNNLMCHHCGYTVGAPSVCPSCGSPYMMKRGVGTQRVEGELRSLLDAELGTEPDAVPVIRMDADTTSKKGAHRQLLDEFAAAPRAVLLGTQMIAKGLDFDEVTLVGVVNADTQLHLPDFRSSERTFDLIEQVAGRAGRGKLLGKVMVQTHEPDDIAIRAAAAYDRDAFLRSELPKRRVLGFPPYVRMANVLVWGRDVAAVEAQARSLQRAIVEKRDATGLSDWEVSPAIPCVFERIRNDFRWHIVVKCPVGKDVSSMLAEVYLKMRKEKGVNVAIDVDPVDLL